MEDNTQDIESTEVVPSREPAELSIRESLSKQLKNQKEEHRVEERRSDRGEGLFHCLEYSLSEGSGCGFVIICRFC